MACHSYYGRGGSPYHVFLSFRGEVRNIFICFLYEALVAAGFLPFMDKVELRGGDELDSMIQQGITNSMSAIIVFSKDYTSSRYCLDELVSILEQRRRVGSSYFIIPILYDVQAKEVKYQLGQFGAALQRHERRHGEERVREWTNALEEIGRLFGEKVDNG